MLVAHSQIQWGNAPAWAAVAVAALGLVAASLGAKFAYRQVQLAEKSSAAREEEGRREQARKVTAWLELESQGFVAYIANTSDLPAYRVVVGFKSPNNDNQIHLPVIPPTHGPTVETYVTQFVNDAARDHPNILVSWTMHGHTGPLRQLQEQPDGTKKWVEAMQLGPVGLTITFSDALGNRWERDLGGQLHERDDDYLPFTGGVVAGGMSLFGPGGFLDLGSGPGGPGKPTAEVDSEQASPKDH